VIGRKALELEEKQIARFTAPGRNIVRRWATGWKLIGERGGGSMSGGLWGSFCGAAGREKRVERSS